MSNILFNTNELNNQNLTGLGVVSDGLYKNFKRLNFQSCKLKRFKYESNFLYKFRRITWSQYFVPKLMKKLGCDLFFSPIIEAPISKKINSVVMAHDLIPLKFPSVIARKILYKTYIPCVLQKSKLIVSNSNATSNELIKNYNIDPRKIYNLKLGYDKENIFSSNVTREQFFLILGRHDYHKNIPNILKAIKLVNKSSFKFVFVGPFHNKLTPLYKRLSFELGISKSCIWQKWVNTEQKRALLNRCKALIMPSLWEGFGIPALEAMACGTPVIGSLTGAMPEVLGDLGILVNPSNINEIADAIIQVENDLKITKKMENLGPIRASSFDWSNSTKNLEKVINNL